jgi:hypothetical protein
MDRIIFTGGGVQYQQLVPNPGGEAAGWFDFVSCTQEVSATPLLDLQSGSFDGYFEGLVQVIIRDYLAADAVLPARYGAIGKPPVVAVNCSAQGCLMDGLQISSAGLDTPYAVRVYAGSVAGATIESASRNTYSAYGVVDRHGLPTGEFRQTTGAGWEMSGHGGDAALTFQVSGETKPSKVIEVDGSVHYCHDHAGDEEADDDDNAEPAVSVLRGHLTNTTSWDAPRLARGSPRHYNLFISPSLLTCPSFRTFQSC